MSLSYHDAAAIMISQYDGIKEKEEVLRFCGYDIDRVYKGAIDIHKDTFYCCKNRLTGKISKTAQQNILNGENKKNTYDHIYARKKSSEDFFKHWQAGRFTKDRLNRAAAWIESRCRVHIVTRDENTKLIPFQNGKDTKHLHHSIQYELAEIELEDKLDLRRRFIYIIDNIEYETSNLAASEAKCSVATVLKKCNSDKYPEWKKVKKF